MYVPPLTLPSAGQVLAGVRGAQLRDLELLHRPGLRALHRELPSRPPWQVKGGPPAFPRLHLRLLEGLTAVHS